MTHVTHEQLAEAFECFWNAAIGEAHNQQDSTALAVSACMATGFAAIANRLREFGADEPKTIKRKIYHRGDNYSFYRTARFTVGNGRSFEFEGYRWTYEHTAFDQRGDYDLIWRPADGGPNAEAA